MRLVCSRVFTVCVMMGWTLCEFSVVCVRVYTVRFSVEIGQDQTWPMGTGT